MTPKKTGEKIMARGVSKFRDKYYQLLSAQFKALFQKETNQSLTAAIRVLIAQGLIEQTDKEKIDIVAKALQPVFIEYPQAVVQGVDALLGEDSTASDLGGMFSAIGWTQDHGDDEEEE